MLRKAICFRLLQINYNQSREKFLILFLKAMAGTGKDRHCPGLPELRQLTLLLRGGLMQGSASRAKETTGVLAALASP